MTNNGVPRLSVGEESRFLSELQQRSNYLRCWTQDVMPNANPHAVEREVAILTRSVKFVHRQLVAVELGKVGWTETARNGAILMRADGTWPIAVRWPLRDNVDQAVITVLADRLYDKLPLQEEVNEFLIDHGHSPIDAAASSFNWALMRGGFLANVESAYAFAHKLRTAMAKHCNHVPRVIEVADSAHVELDAMRVTITPTRNGWVRFILEFDPQYERAAA